MIIDNYNFFRDKLEFTNPGDFYVIQIVIRHKDIVDKTSNNIYNILLKMLIILLILILDYTRLYLKK